MKALSIRQPWAGLVVLGIKDVENRTWDVIYRGPLAVHAGQGEDQEAWALLERGTAEPWASARERLRRTTNNAPMERVRRLPAFSRGCVVGRVVLVGVTDGRRERATSAWAEPDCRHWHLAEAVPLQTPVRWRGQLGLFDIPDGVALGDVPARAFR